MDVDLKWEMLTEFWFENKNLPILIVFLKFKAKKRDIYDKYGKEGLNGGGGGGMSILHKLVQSLLFVPGSQ